MPSKYLYLSNLQKQTSTNNSVYWENLPVLSEARRECYINVVHSAVVFDNSNPIDSNEVLVHLKLPSLNYFTSDNTTPVMAYLHSVDKKTFEQAYQSPVELLSNDGLKKVEIELRDNSDDLIDLSHLESVSVVLKIDYIDQQNMTNEYLSQSPSLLG